MLFGHFAKRVAETLSVHQYSGSMARSTGGFIGVFYALVTALVLWQQGRVPASVYEAGASGAMLSAGLALFVVGQLGNFYHHWLLATARAAPVGSMISAEDLSRLLDSPRIVLDLPPALNPAPSLTPSLARAWH